MQIQLLKSKLHRAVVTESNLNYEGSLSVDVGLMEQIGMRPHERILCGNMGNGERFETYVIPAPRGSGDIVLNGATARLGKAGDLLTIMSFAFVTEEEASGWQPRTLVLGEGNVAAVAPE